MMTGYSIEEQEEGRGDNKHTVLIKQTTKGVGQDKQTGQKTNPFPLKSANGNTLPCLKVKLSNPARPDHRFEVRWSNYYEQTSASPGKFKLCRVEQKPLMRFVMDGNRKRMVKGRPQLDYLAMTMAWGTDYDHETGKWTYGENHPMEQVVDELWETESIDHAIPMLAERFGEELATEVLELFVEHELFTGFVGVKAAA